MKVALDIEKLRSEGRITSLEYEKLQRLAREGTDSLGVNILIGFGVVATAAGTLAKLHSSEAAIALGMVLGTMGVLIVRHHTRRWHVLGSILTLVGAVTAAGGFISLGQGARDGFLYATLLFVVGALAAKSGLLAVLSALALAGVVGAGTEPGSFLAIVQKPTMTIGVFGLLSWAAIGWSTKLGQAHCQRRGEKSPVRRRACPQDAGDFVP